jgi:uncharacterized membrane protein
MLTQKKFPYKPHESELERASNSYLVSLVAVVAGLPIPLLNLVASLIFLLGNQKSTPFVKWHAMHSFLSQIVLFLFNSFAFWSTLAIVFSKAEVNYLYISYMVFVVLYNIFEFISTIYLGIQTRKGIHVEILFFGTLTDRLVNKKR